MPVSRDWLKRRLGQGGIDQIGMRYALSLAWVVVMARWLVRIFCFTQKGCRVMTDSGDGTRLELMRAGDVMTAAPRTCSTFSTVLEAVMIFRNNDCGAVPILEEGKPVAVLTDRDVALAISEYNSLASQTVGSIMTPGVVSVGPEDRLEHVVDVLRTSGVRRVLVLDAEGRVLGIIGWSDIAPVLSDGMMGQVVKDVVAPA
jgi:CBS domain-containing protein